MVDEEGVGFSSFTGRGPVVRTSAGARAHQRVCTEALMLGDTSLREELKTRHGRVDPMASATMEDLMTVLRELSTH